jgi:pimeloyl-ACP methyl ester carboxylesterase
VTDRTIGEPKETLVFLHGIAGSGKMWDKVVAELDDVRVISIDLLGFGVSPRPKHLSYTIADHTKMLRYTLRRKRVKGRVRLIGYSLGALVAVEYAMRHKRDVASLILCAPPLYTNEELLDGEKKTLADRQSNALLNLYRELRKRPDWTIEAAAKAKVVLPIARTMTITEDNWFSFYHTLENSIERQTTLLDIKNIRKPTTIVYGTADPVIITGHIKEIAKQNPHIRVVSILGGTHLLDKRFRNTLLKEIAKQLER